MPASLDHDKLNRILMSKAGIAATPHFNRRETHRPATKQQIEYIETLAKEIKEHGLACDYILEDPKWKWKVYHEDAYHTIKALLTVKHDNKIFNGNYKVYHYLVKGPDGKRYEYITNHYRAFPKGYSMIGELKRESIPQDVYKLWTKEERLREFKGGS